MPPDENDPEVERLNRNYDQLLNELRVALPGVQVLFAFLLAVPFSRGFAGVSAFQRDVYFATLLLAALASMFLIAPSIHHRLLFRQGYKAQLVRSASRLAIAGISSLALAMTGALLLVSDALFDEAVAVAVSTAAFACCAWLWYGVPLVQRLRDRRGERLLPVGRAGA